MKSVRVDASKLLEILRKNREVHIKEFNEAVTEHRAKVIEQMKKNLTQAEDGGKLVCAISLPEPKSYESSYNLAIKMLEMSLDKEIELSYDEFQQYVEDEWGWKNSFTATASLYKTFQN